MSKITGRCNPGVSDGTRSETVTGVIRRLTPTPGSASNSSSSRTTGVHGRSALVKSSAPRKPLPYRVFAGREDIGHTDMVLADPDFAEYTFGYTGRFTPFPVMLYHGTRNSAGSRIPDTSANMENRAITECLNNLQDGKMNILASLYEARQSVDLIAVTMSRIIRAYRYARRGRWSQAGNILTGLSLRGTSRPVRGWLTFHYAVLPMLGDIQGAIALVKQGLREPVIRARRYVSGDYGLPPRPANGRAWRVNGTCEVGVEVCIRARLKQQYVDVLDQIGLFNPFAFGWEIIPYSFVIDWLIPVGNALEALTAPMGLEFHDGYVNHKLVSSFKWEGYSYSRDYVRGTMPSGVVTNVAQRRVPLLSLPDARLYMKSPFSTNHVVSALALLAAARYL